MVDLDTFQEIFDDMPRLNPRLSEGLAVSELAGAEKAIDQVLEVTQKAFPPGFTYEGMSPISPDRQFQVAVTKDGDGLYEVLHSDTYLAQVNFAWRGEMLPPQFIQIPYVHKGGIWSVRGAGYVVSPTLTDKNFSVSSKSIFMQLTQTRLTIEDIPYWYRTMDGGQVDVHVPHSRLHNDKNDKPPKAMVSTLIHYVFTEYGPVDAFKRFFNCDIVIGGDEINEDKYPSDKYTICLTGGVKPRCLMRKEALKLPVRIALPKDDALRQDVRSAIAGFFYILDHCGNEPYIVLEDINDRELWRRLLMRFLWRVDNELAEKPRLDKHLSSVLNYMDEIVRRRLLTENIVANDLFDLLVYIIRNYTDIKTARHPADGANKIYSVLPEILYPITSMITNLNFKLQKYAIQTPKPDDVRNTVNRHFNNGAILSAPAKLACVNGLDSSTDQMLMKISTSVSPRKKGKSRSSEVHDDAFKFHPSIVLTNSFSFISKSSPSGRSKLNPFTQLGPHNEILLPQEPELKALLENLYELLGYESPYGEIYEKE